MIRSLLAEVSKSNKAQTVPVCMLRNVIQEGDFSHAMPPTVWFTGWSQSVDAILDNISSMPMVALARRNGIENDGSIGGGGTNDF